MNYMLLGLLFSSVFGVFVVVILNYAVFLWQNEKIESLRQHTNSQSNSKKAWSDGIKTTTTWQGAANLYDKALLNISHKDYPQWLIKILLEVDKIRKNLWAYLRGWVNYFVSLARPNSKAESEELEDPLVNPLVEEEEQKEATVEKILSISDNKGKFAAAQNKEEEQEEDIFTWEKEPLESHKTDTAKRGGMATINLASDSGAQENAEMSIFEKMEKRILTKLKDSGLVNYEVWLELGDLYQKYEEGEKAKEVYSLVLKHSQGRERDLARDRLIALV